MRKSGLRPGFLAGTEYWFGEITQSDELYKPETKVEWYDEFYVEDPFWEKYV